MHITRWGFFFVSWMRSDAVFPLYFPVEFPVFDAFPFIVDFFTLGEADLHFCQAFIAEENPQGDDAVTFLFDFGFQPA